MDMRKEASELMGTSKNEARMAAKVGFDTHGLSQIVSSKVNAQMTAEGVARKAAQQEQEVVTTTVRSRGRNIGGLQF